MWCRLGLLREPPSPLLPAPLATALQRNSVGHSQLFAFDSSHTKTLDSICSVCRKEAPARALTTTLLCGLAPASHIGIDRLPAMLELSARELLLSRFWSSSMPLSSTRARRPRRERIGKNAECCRTKRQEGACVIRCAARQECPV